MVLEGSAVPVAVVGHDEALAVVQAAAPDPGPTGRRVAREADPMAWAVVAVAEAGLVASGAARAVVPGCSAVPWVAPAAAWAALMAVGPVPSRSSPLRFVSHLTPQIDRRSGFADSNPSWLAGAHRSVNAAFRQLWSFCRMAGDNVSNTRAKVAASTVRSTKHKTNRRPSPWFAIGCVVRRSDRRGSLGRPP